MAKLIAKIAVAAATYGIDKPYDYLVPKELADRINVGTRVSVPFGKGNRRSEGVVLAVSESSTIDELKSVLSILDEERVLSAEQVKLALFMRERFFCTVYDAVRAILPAGLWFDLKGKRKANDKTVEIATLAISGEEAAALAKNGPRA